MIEGVMKISKPVIVVGILLALFALAWAYSEEKCYFYNAGLFEVPC
jgi:hypothetical protein